MHTLSIVVVTRNSAAFIHECLRSVFSQALSPECEVLVVDNASTDETLRIIETQFPHIRVIRNADNRGFNAANNQGIRSTDAAFVLLLNPDTRLAPHALERLLHYLKEHDDVAAVGPKILNADGSLQRTGVSFPSLWNTFSEALFLDALFPESRLFGRHRKKYRNPEEPHEVDYVQGSCLMLRRAAVEQIGFLDEDYFLYFDETDTCYRFRQHGWHTFYVPEAMMTHFGAGGASYYDEVRLSRFYQSYIRFLKKHYGVIRQQMFRALLTLRASVRLMTFSLGSVLSRQREDEFRKRGKAYRSAVRTLLKFK